MNRFFALFLSVSFVAAAVFTATCFGQKVLVDADGVSKGDYCVIVDAGHGGEDGGAVGINGENEKDINLSIALKLQALLNSVGIDTIAIRKSDISVCDEGLATVRQRKVSDIHNRMAVIDSNPNAVFVSIHQNHFTASKYSGTQVFYSKNDYRSKLLAQSIQSRVVENIQADNKREIKPAGTNLYLLHNAKSTAVMVECGFLSNPTEAKLLTTDEYRSKMAFAVFCGIIEFYNIMEN